MKTTLCGTVPRKLRCQRSYRLVPLYAPSTALSPPAPLTTVLLLYFPLVNHLPSLVLAALGHGRPSQVGFVEVGFTEVNPPEVRPFEVGHAEVRVGEVRL